jgi:hypothetical protein
MSSRIKNRSRNPLIHKAIRKLESRFRDIEYRLSLCPKDCEQRVELEECLCIARTALARLRQDRASVEDVASHLRCVEDTLPTVFAEAVVKHIEDYVQRIIGKSSQSRARRLGNTAAKHLARGNPRLAESCAVHIVNMCGGAAVHTSPCQRSSVNKSRPTPRFTGRRPLQLSGRFSR